MNNYKEITTLGTLGSLFTLCRFTKVIDEVAGEEEWSAIMSGDEIVWSCTRDDENKMIIDWVMYGEKFLLYTTYNDLLKDED